MNKENRNLFSRCKNKTPWKIRVLYEYNRFESMNDSGELEV